MRKSPTELVRQFGQAASRSSKRVATKVRGGKLISRYVAAFSSGVPTTATRGRRPAPEKTSTEGGSSQRGTARTKPTTPAKAEASEASREVPPREKEVRRTVARPTAARMVPRPTSTCASSLVSATESGRNSKRV